MAVPQHPPAWPDDARRDRLIGDWHIYQREGGHRTSTDDLITAWYAVHRVSRPPARYLDLGCGLGSVLLMVSHRLRPALAHGVEAQAQSVSLAQRAIAELPEHESKVSVDHADFRRAFRDVCPHDLIFLDPPYLSPSVERDPRAYTASRFSQADLRDLQSLIERCVAKGVNVIFCWGSALDSGPFSSGSWTKVGRDCVWTSYS